MSAQDPHAKPLTYLSYLKLDEVLSLQCPLSEGPEHDELLFIVIHQVYELWFKLVIHELEHLNRAFVAGDAANAIATLGRVLSVFKTLVAQIDVIETMTPASFSSFRERLESASGFQSAQFRELEFMLGHKRAAVVAAHPPGGRGRVRLEARLGEPSVYDCFLRYLAAHGHSIPESLLERDFGAAPEPSPAVQDVLVRVYRDTTVDRLVCEHLVDLDEGIQEWRYRHMKMVERTIGTKSGTGGSTGAAYLKETLFRPLFADLWAIRSRL